MEALREISQGSGFQMLASIRDYTGLCKGYIGIMENKMETTIMVLYKAWGLGL